MTRARAAEHAVTLPEVNGNGYDELATFYAQLQKVRPPIAKSASLPSVSYSSANVLTQEKQAIFRQFLDLHRTFGSVDRVGTIQ